MSIKHMALAVALSLSMAPLAVAQSVENPPSGSMGMNKTVTGHGTLNTNHKLSHRTKTSRKHVSHKTVQSQEKPDRSQGTAQVEGGNGTGMGTSTAKTMQGMSNGTAVNSSQPSVPVKANGGG